MVRTAEGKRVPEKSGRHSALVYVCVCVCVCVCVYTHTHTHVDGQLCSFIQG
jgi:hypothetical protein